MIREFEGIFGSSEGVRVYRAPGRVNLIGEHTDYNLGFVLPMALDLATYVAVAPSRDGVLRIHSEHQKETREWHVEEVGTLSPAGHWTDYPIGVARELLQLGFSLEPANILIRSTVPEGSGLSSSAALEVSSALGFLNGRQIDPKELALLCQRAERNFVGVPCGIMDQYIAVFGREHSAVEIDCRSLGHRYVRLPEDAAFVAVNTMVKHALGASAYKDRVRECAEAVTTLKIRYPEIASLRDLSPQQYEAGAHLLPPLVERRARHVVTENARVNQFVEASASGDKATMGNLMLDSHRSLRYDYEVSCEELDFLVERAVSIDGVYGSRMTGGGFGGCTVTMLRPDAVTAFSERIAAEYESKFQIKPLIYSCLPAQGAEEVKNLETIPGAN